MISFSKESCEAMNKNKLKAKIVEHGDTQRDLADALNIALSNLSLRINGKVDFRQDEILAIKKRYKLSAEEVENIFLTD